MVNRPVLLSVDHVGVHHREMDEGERGGVVEELCKMEDQTMTSANDLEPHAIKNIARAKCARCGVLFTREQLCERSHVRVPATALLHWFTGMGGLFSGGVTHVHARPTAH